MVGDQQDPGGAGITGSVDIYWPGNSSFTAGPPLPRAINEAAVVQGGMYKGRQYSSGAKQFLTKGREVA